MMTGRDIYDNQQGIWKVYRETPTSDNEKIECTFTIKPLDLADAVIKNIPDQKFKGNYVGEKSVLYLIK